MRNGFYRTWLKAPGLDASGAVMFEDGDIIACDKYFALIGHYVEQNGWMTADVFCKRLNEFGGATDVPDIEEFEIKLEGSAGREFATLKGTIPEIPSFTLTFECTWLCEL